MVRIPFYIPSCGVTHTDQTKDDGLALWVVLLGGWFKISKVKVWNRTECAGRLAKAMVYVGKKKIGVVNYEEGKQCYEFDADGYCAKAVGVALTTGEPLSLAQVEVLGTGEEGSLIFQIFTHIFRYL